MISFLHPGFLYAAAAASAVVVALHFLVAEQPRAGVLPTVRFFPDVEVRSTTLRVRLSDILLLLVRVLTLLLIGAAFAQTRLKPSRDATLAIVAVDVSRGVGKAAEVADSAARYLNGAAAVVVFDSVANEVNAAQAARSLDSLKLRRPSVSRGSVSSALIVALRAASRLRERADSLDMTLISPLLAEELDSATPELRAMWPGRIHVVRVAPARDTSASRAATVEWADSAATTRWTAKAPPDTIGGVQFAGGVAVYPFVRKWKLAGAVTGDRVVARWIDGEPAIVEAGTAAGCVRSSSVPMPTAGDAILRPSFARLMETIRAPCARAIADAPAESEALRTIAGPAHLASTASIAPEAARPTPLVVWLLVGALLLALLELFVRRRGERSHARRDDYAAAGIAEEGSRGKVA